MVGVCWAVAKKLIPTNAIRRKDFSVFKERERLNMVNSLCKGSYRSGLFCQGSLFIGLNAEVSK